jgi:hypothetical protein
MDTKIMFLIFFLNPVSLYAVDTEPNKLREEQIYKVVEAIWKEPPQSIDVTLYAKIETKPKTREELEKIYEDIFEKSEGPRDKLPDVMVEERNKIVQLNVEKVLKEQEVGRKIKQRIRIDGYRQRIDEVFGRSEMVLLKGTKFERTEPEVVLGPNTPYDFTFINLGNPKLGDYTYCQYIHSSKMGSITNQKGFYLQKSKIGELVCWPPENRPIFRALVLGKEEDSGAGKIFVPDEQKIESLIKDDLEKVSVKIRPDVNEPDFKSVIEIKMPKNSSEPGLILVCDKSDYSKIYYFEAKNTLNGKTLFKRECDNFDKYGFPHNATIIEYDMDGKIVEKKVYKIEKVELNPTIPDEVFNFKPPSDYKISDMRSVNSGKNQPIENINK